MTNVIAGDDDANSDGNDANLSVDKKSRHYNKCLHPSIVTGAR